MNEAVDANAQAFQRNLQSQESQFHHLINDYSFICSSGNINKAIVTTQDSRQKTVKTHPIRGNDAHSNFSNGVIFNTMNNQNVPSQMADRDVQI